MDVDTFTAERNAWKAKGRPADMADPYWRSVIADAADRAALDFGYVTSDMVAPLVVLGAMGPVTIR